MEAPPASVAGCRHARNPHHRCSDFCRATAAEVRRRCCIAAASSALRQSAEAPRRAHGSSTRRWFTPAPRRQPGQQTPRAVSWTASLAGTPADTPRLRSARRTTLDALAAPASRQHMPRSSQAWRARACLARSPKRRRAATRQRRVRQRRTSPARRALTRVPAARRGAEGAGQQALRSRSVPRSDRSVQRSHQAARRQRERGRLAGAR